jgi:hypothetical protein
MATSLDPLGIRARLGRDAWALPEPMGSDGWAFRSRRGPRMSVIATCSDAHDDVREWVHASISHEHRMPSYEELQALHRAVWRDGYAYQVFAPAAAHISGEDMGPIGHPYALHLWGLLSGERVLPDFGWLGHI